VTTTMQVETDTMRAVLQRGYGSTDVWHVGGAARPEPGAGEVLVQVRAAGLDRGTWHLMTGTPLVVRPVIGLRRPRNPVPGRDVAGTVVGVGDGVTRFRLGDEVFGTADGSFAEYALAPAKRLVTKPADLGWAQAAASPVSGLTALHGLVDVGRLAAGQRVLVTGASGGVGSFAVQMAKALGAEVTAVASEAKADFVCSLGADRVLDPAADVGADHDLILDIVASAPLARLRRALTPKGTLVVVGAEGSGRWIGLRRQLRAVVTSPFIRQRLAMLVSKENQDGLTRLAELLASGAVAPAVDRTFALEDAAAAMAHLVERQVRGKVVVVP
jgi:NADPH:quinone reductase-like Zn-dependent oxidoreductase